MDTRTGQLHDFFHTVHATKDIVPVNDSDMTQKQKETRQVSKYDNISTLGKLFTGCRKQRREEAKLLKKRLIRGV